MVWLVRVPEYPGAGVEWLPVGAGDAGHGHGSLAELLAAVSAADQRQPLVLLLPASCALVATVAAPVRNPRQLQQALPFLVEEMLAADIDSLHIVAGQRMADGRVQVAAIERSLLAGVLARFREAGLDPEVVTLDALLLPFPADGVGLYLDGAHSLLASATGQVLALHEADVAEVIDSLPPADVAGRELRLFPAGEDALVAANALASAADDRLRVVVDAESRPLLPLLASGDALRRVRRSINLRQGAFARQSSGSLDPGFDWRPLAAIAVAWAVVAMGYQVALGISHGRAADAVREAEVALYRQLFPGVTQVPDPRRQMQGQLNAVAGTEAAFSRLVAEAAGVVAELDNGSGRYQTRSMAWDKALGQLRMDVVARSLEDIEALRQRLESRGLQVDIGSGVSQDGGYRARINLGVGA